VALPDDKRGEQIVLVTDCDEANRPALSAGARDAGLPEIFVPRTIIKVDAVPLLGTGKIDYISASQLVTASTRP
jgi:acyl-[acyl-carrier-protein]-phospholipid O-acyltransferase/long-chain-fatty-acid--[acyl-carrier-protein] ligase